MDVQPAPCRASEIVSMCSELSLKLAIYDGGLAAQNALADQADELDGAMRRLIDGPVGPDKAGFAGAMACYLAAAGSDDDHDRLIVVGLRKLALELGLSN